MLGTKLRLMSGGFHHVQAWSTISSTRSTLSRAKTDHRTRWLSEAIMGMRTRRKDQVHTQYSLALYSSARDQRWQVGDDVAFTADGRMRTGTILERKGGGWFRVLSDDATTRSLRTYQLQSPVEGKVEDMTEISPLSRNGTLSDADNGTQAKPMTSEFEATTSPQEQEQEQVQVKSEMEEEGSVPFFATQIVPPTTTPPPPSMFDLDAEVYARQIAAADPVESVDHVQYLRQVENHMQYTQWVVFTDLHCAPSSLDTCLQVLDLVHALAVEKHAGIVFLGDFWHHRGTLRVDCLNAVLQKLRSWTQPCVMIPGNHDQVTLGGGIHSLTPLLNAYRVTAAKPLAKTSMYHSGKFTDSSFPGPLIFTDPTKFLNALFIPHIRDPATMESILMSNMAHDSSAILVHADVTGAYMNDMIISSGGVPPSMFPPNKPIYSGHFHKPHVVRSSGRTIEYLGSPYQVSLAEAHQDKSIVILDSLQGWKCIERIPIAIGRKHFRLETLNQLFELQLVKSASSDEYASNHWVRHGDRVVLSLDKKELESADVLESGQENSLSSYAATLRQAGIVVEIREAQAVPLTSLDTDSNSPTECDVEGLTSESTLRSFLDEEVRETVFTEKAADNFFSEGLKILEELESEENNGGFDGGASELTLTEVTVDGYGPFLDKQVYPLDRRGLVLVRGENRDGGSDSNGSGKSFLASASLWCLTGALDSRPFQDAKVGDVVNDNVKTARVTVRGFFNGAEFSVSRSKSSSKTGLTFLLDGVDHTAQSPKETQVIMENKLNFNAQLLERVVFQGQHNLNGLLEATDSALKDQLSLVVPLVLWQSASSIARRKSAGAKKKSNEISGMLSIRTTDQASSKSKLEISQSDFEHVQSNYEIERGKLLHESRQLSEAIENASKTRIVLEAQVKETSEDVQILEAKHESYLEEHTLMVNPLKEQLDRLQVSLNSLDSDSEALARKHVGISATLTHTMDRLRGAESMWDLDLSEGTVPKTLTLPKFCPTCHHPLNSTEDHSQHDHLESTVRAELSSLLLALQQTRNELIETEDKIASTATARDEVSKSRNKVQSELDNIVGMWNKDSADVDFKLKAARERKDKATLDLTTFSKRNDNHTRASELKFQLEAIDGGLRAAEDAISKAQNDVKSLEAVVQELQTEMKRESSSASMFSDLSDVFGPRGIQAFVLSNAVQQLQSLTQGFLDELSDGNLQLKITIDAGDRIERRALLRQASGDFRERALSSLSGGQWRRCSLALTLGFAEWVARREQFRSNVMFLDEPLAFLDRSGRADVGRVLRRLLSSNNSDSSNRGLSRLQVQSIILILQDLAAEELEEAFDAIDVVVKEDGKSVVQVNVSS